mmetsp:Transcript_29669/g.47883  ORF Transcript_29669/g.47883 Transcript_29669/m.47883 type:complete len:99 (-) Transcript_29669:42-338(-)
MLSTVSFFQFPEMTRIDNQDSSSPHSNKENESSDEAHSSKAAESSDEEVDIVPPPKRMKKVLAPKQAVVNSFKAPRPAAVLSSNDKTPVLRCFLYGSR